MLIGQFLRYYIGHFTCSLHEGKYGLADIRRFMLSWNNTLTTGRHRQLKQ